MNGLFKILLLFAGAFLIRGAAFGQLLKPYLLWTFEEPDAEKKYSCPVEKINSPSGSGLDLKSSDCIFTTGAFVNREPGDLSIAFLFKGKSFQFLTYGEPHFMLQFSYNGLVFRTTHNEKGKPIRHHWLIPMNGSGIRSYSRLADDQWHLLVFTYSIKTGEKRIWIDGESPDAFRYSLPAGSPLLMGRNDGFRNTQQLDELAFYKEALNGKQVAGLYTQYLGKQRSSSLNSEIEGVDPSEFAPGYPNYTVSSIDQLKRFPLPRYQPANLPNRNINWMDITYLHRQPDPDNNFRKGIINPAKAVEMSVLLSENFHYYLDIPVLRWKPEVAIASYSNPSTLYGALIQLANQRPDLPVSALLFQSQVNQRHIGGPINGSYVVSQQLPAHYYMRDQQGQFIKAGKQKLLSPLMNLDIIEKDARLSALYTRTLLEQLKNKPSLINENGEVFGHFQKASVLQMDPKVAADFKASRLTESQYAGRFQYRRDSVYKSTILKELNYKVPAFTFYNISAIQPAYWPDYATKRRVNAWASGKIYPTPDFYPRTPDNWVMGRGAFNGYGNIAAGRKTEIGLGDTDFAPFVSAGWNKEEANIRPAQWLALLKSMVMLGAEHFYAGYFNITGSGGKWPNGIGPYDPRGYIYQAAMPAYAQAIRSLVPEFFTSGQLLEPEIKSSAPFRFSSWAENHLILVRKHLNRFLIYGSIQPNNNNRNNLPEEVIATIQLEGKSISFPIRRQGSMYLLNLSQQNPTLIQLDGWHQFEHPYFWTKNCLWEAELFSTLSGQSALRTFNKEALDFATFKTMLEMAPGAVCSQDITGVRKGCYQVKLNSASVQVPDQLIVEVHINGKIQGQSLAELEKKEWLIHIPDKSEIRIKLKNLSGRLALIDNIELEWKAETP